MDPRHEHRIKIIQELFSYTYVPSDKNFDEETKEILKHTADIDAMVNNYADKFQTDKIAKVDLAILRLAIYEIKYRKDIPEKVSINEAVELAKELGGENTPAFVNAVLGKIVGTEE